MNVSYRAIRANGNAQEAQGEESWTELLEHLDVCSGCEDGAAHNPEVVAKDALTQFDVFLTPAPGEDKQSRTVSLRLGPTDRLVFVRRHILHTSGAPIDLTTVVGVRHADGTGTFTFIAQDGALHQSSDFNARFVPA